VGFDRFSAQRPSLVVGRSVEDLAKMGGSLIAFPSGLSLAVHMPFQFQDTDGDGYHEVGRDSSRINHDQPTHHVSLVPPPKRPSRMGA
jgi:hypothetical protein